MKPIDPRNLQIGEYAYCRVHDTYWVATLRGNIQCDSMKEVIEEIDEVNSILDSSPCGWGQG